MRVDHHAYRKATGVAGFGFLLQGVMALVLLVFGQLSGDTVFRFAATYFFGGLLLWLSLIAVLNQHRQERLDSLEADELMAARAGTGSVFQSGREELGPSARRLRLMHKWLMPAVSLLVATYLALAAWWMLAYLNRLDDPSGTGTVFLRTPRLGWAVATCLSFAAVSFIVSRFVAGMAKQTAWQNLRGGAGYMVGNTLVMVAASVGIICRFFDKDEPILVVAYAIPIFMIILAGEILFNFLLNLYRPRVAGEVPRPAYDSRVLSLLAVPESVVQTLSEAVNYQFGFDVTSSWGYQLMLRSFGWLLGFGVVVMIGLNMMVVVEPHQQAVKLAGGAIVGEPGEQVHEAGIMWKLPWPLQTAAVYDVSRIRKLPLTAQRLEHPDVQLWSRDIDTDTELDPFLVGSSGSEMTPATSVSGENVDGSPSAGDHFALVDAEITLLYRINPDGLLDYLNFGSDAPRRRQRRSMREGALRVLALREITQELSRLSMEDIVADRRAEVIDTLRERIQEAYRRHSTGIEVVALNFPLLRPSGEVATNYEDFAMAIQQRRQMVAEAEGDMLGGLVLFVGNAESADEILAALDRWRALRSELGHEAREAINQRLLVERMLADAGGQLAQLITAAESQRWVTLMESRAQAKQFQGQIVASRAAPRLYRQREIMKVLGRTLGTRRKFILVGIDPERLNLDIEVQQAPSMFSIPPQGESQ